ncbi:protein kinase domain-containing protein [Tundrisphaera sp. TA3]|uniref:protein kinase domain-containing protein n=1 Tax=Tundrisphaera sp. TA3 TaxID=3435775 RepID=UPI003EBCA912
MNRPPSNEPFLNWNLVGSDEASGTSADLTMNWPGQARPTEDGAWDAAFSGGPGPRLADPAADFTLHPGAIAEDPPTLARPSDAETLGPPAFDEAVTVDRARIGASEGGEAIAFPRKGDGIGGFRLISELGRGAFGRVFLAEESGLGNRAVALKVSLAEGDEPRILARLQHTHIVPIYSVQDDPTTGLRLMCMPYYGGANLAQVLEAAGTSTAESGPTAFGVERSLIEALDLVGHPAAAEPGRSVMAGAAPPGGDDAGPGAAPPGPTAAGEDEVGPAQPARQFLRQASSIRAAVWIAARLAEGLEHAHSRGLLHRDLKPSNILIAADGTPMLLDFNLATDAPGPDGANKAMMGGTLPYMSPEHLDAFNPRGSTRPEAVDERSDLYGLGLILFEMIAGRPPFSGAPPDMKLIDAVAAMTEERRKPAPSLRSMNPDVPWSLDSIVSRCLCPDPQGRYQRAGELAEDLRRFLDDQPLRFAPEPSLRERAAKWARRNPKLVGATPVALLSVILLALAGGSAWSLSRHLQRASARLGHDEFRSRFQECQFLLNTTAGSTGYIHRGIERAEEALALAGVEDRGRGRGRSWVDALDAEEREEARRDLTELILLVCRARVVRAEKTRSEAQLRAALETAIARLDAAERRDPSPPRALFADRARYHASLGNAGLADRDRRRRDQILPASGRDFYMIGTAWLAEGRLDRAEEALDRAVRADSRRFWSWFSLGLCHYEQRRFPAAAGDFAVCTVLAPKFAWPWMNRGLALAHDGRLVEAREAYGQALKVDPDFAEALVNRGLAHLELGDPAAIDDFKRAMELGRREASVRSALGEALARHGRHEEAQSLFAKLIEENPDAPSFRAVRGMALLKTDLQGAEADFAHVLRHHPGHPLAQLGMARFHHRKEDYRAALDAVEAALRADPSRIDAVELRAWLRGRLGIPSAVDDVDRLVARPTRDRLYNAACSLALLAQAQPGPALTDRAIELLRRAIDLDFPLEKIRNDPDLEILRTTQAYRALIGPRHHAVPLP